jgi:hypothetical protein
LRASINVWIRSAKLKVILWLVLDVVRWNVGAKEEFVSIGIFGEEVEGKTWWKPITLRDGHATR